MKLLRDLDFAGKRVFVRADLDIPLAEGQLTNEERLAANADLEKSRRLLGIKPTIDYLRQHGASQIIIAGKIGRPKGKADPLFSTLRIKSTLEKILEVEIVFCDQVEAQPKGKVALLENTHFWPGELEPNDGFARKLAKLADVYVNENFASAHRNEATQMLLPKLLPCAAGLNLEKEINELSKLLENPKRPFIAVIGGAKIETKVPAITNLASVADKVLVGGYLPIEIGKQGLTLPPNVVVAEVTKDGMDITSESVGKFERVLSDAVTVVLNGPMGRYEDGFGEATKRIAEAVIKSGAYSVIGGGNTEEFLQKEGFLDKFSFVSSGGGSMLEFLAGKELPGLKALE